MVTSRNCCDEEKPLLQVVARAVIEYITYEEANVIYFSFLEKLGVYEEKRYWRMSVEFGTLCWKIWRKSYF